MQLIHKAEFLYGDSAIFTNLLKAKWMLKMKSYTLGFSLWLVILGAGLHAEQPAQRDSSIPKDTQKAIDFLDYVENTLGFSGLTVTGFDGPRGEAVTGIMIGEEPGPEREYHDLRTAEIAKDKVGINVWFRTYNKCAVTTTKRKAKYVDRIIKVDGQRIKTDYGCAPIKSQRGGMTQEIYFISTPAGRDFVRDRFLKQNYVFVDLGDGLEVPYSAKGFTKLWNSMSRPAL